MKSKKTIGKFVALLVTFGITISSLTMLTACGESEIKFTTQSIDAAEILTAIELPDTMKAASGDEIVLPELKAGVVKGKSYVWKSSEGKTYKPGVKYKVDKNTTFTATFSYATIIDFANKMDPSAGFTLTGDMTWSLLPNASTNMAGEGGISGEWSFDGEKIILTDDVATDSTREIDVTNPDADGIITGSTASQSGTEGCCPVARFISNYNKYFGATYATGPVTSYKLSFSLSDGTGTTPTAIEYGFNSSVTLPSANGLSKDNYEFAGWTIEGKVYDAEKTLEIYCGNLTATANWQKKAFLTSNVLDEYMLVYVAYGQPLTFYVDGTCSAVATQYNTEDAPQSDVSIAYGTWEVKDGVLTVKNKDGEVVNITLKDGVCTYEYIVYDKEGYGNADAYPNKTTQTFNISDFISAYNAQFGKNITSLTVEEGTAELISEKTSGGGGYGS